MTDPLMTVADLAKYLQCSPATVRRNVHAKKWPHWAGGERTIRFRPEDVKRIEDLGHREPKPTRRRRTKDTP